MVTVHADGLTEFRFFRPGAGRVFLAGDFNGWRGDQLRMLSQGDGYWILKLALPTGHYKFRYVADGLWYTDYAASGVEPGRFGMDSLLRVPPRRLVLPAPVTSPAAAVAAV